MKAKHTPGDWKVSKLSGKALISGDACGAKNVIVVAEVTKFRQASVTEANARLIAAAPELLEACKATLAGIDHACKNAEWRESQLHTLIPRLTSAIANADGTPEVHELPTDEELSERTGLNVEDWVQEVSQGNTRRSYSDWLNENAEPMKGGAS